MTLKLNYSLIKIDVFFFIIIIYLQVTLQVRIISVCMYIAIWVCSDLCKYYCFTRSEVYMHTITNPTVRDNHEKLLWISRVG